MIIAENRLMVMALESISLEAGVLNNLVKTVRGYFPDLLDGFRETTKMDVDGIEKPVNTTKEQKILLKHLDGQNYLDYMNTPIVVPEGFDFEFIPALNICENAIKVCNHLIENHVKHYRVYISSFITNRDMKISLHDNTKLYKSTTEELKNLNAGMAAMYNGNTFEATQPLKKLIRRNADLDKCFTLSNRTGASLQALNLTDLKKNMQDIAALIDTVIKMVEGDKITNVSPESVMNLAQGAKVTAEAAETIASVYFRILGIVNSVNNIPSAFLVK